MTYITSFRLRELLAAQIFRLRVLKSDANTEYHYAVKCQTKYYILKAEKKLKKYKTEIYKLEQQWIQQTLPKRY